MIRVLTVNMGRGGEGQHLWSTSLLGCGGFLADVPGEYFIAVTFIPRSSPSTPKHKKQRPRADSAERWRVGFGSDGRREVEAEGTRCTPGV